MKRNPPEEIKIEKLKLNEATRYHQISIETDNPKQDLYLDWDYQECRARPENGTPKNRSHQKMPAHCTTVDLTSDRARGTERANTKQETRT